MQAKSDTVANRSRTDVAIHSRSGRLPSVQAVIFCWKEHEQRALHLERKLGTFLSVTVINSDTSARERQPHWVHLDDSAYFSEQWNTALGLFDADVLFHIQADADADDMPAIVAKARRLFDQYPLGVYEPNVSYTDICYDTDKLVALETDVLQVPWTDCTCWFIHRDVIDHLPRFDLTTNVYGWGVCRAIAAIARLQGRLCVRDYTFTVRHPKRRGYPSRAAMHELERYVSGLDTRLREEIARLEQCRQATRIQPR